MPSGCPPQVGWPRTVRRCHRVAGAEHGARGFVRDRQTVFFAVVFPLMFLALLSGAMAKTTEGAVNLANFFVLPMAFLSGTFFSLDGAPTWLQIVSRAMPLRYLNEGMQDVMVRGQGPEAAVVPLAVLLGFTVVVGLVAVRLFRWEGD